MSQDVVAAHLSGLHEPKLGKDSYCIADSDEMYLALRPNDLTAIVPDYATRRALIAKDSLCSVDGSVDFNVFLFAHDCCI